MSLPLIGAFRHGVLGINEAGVEIGGSIAHGLAIE